MTEILQKNKEKQGFFMIYMKLKAINISFFMKNIGKTVAYPGAIC